MSVPAGTSTVGALPGPLIIPGTGRENNPLIHHPFAEKYRMLGGQLPWETYTLPWVFPNPLGRLGARAGIPVHLPLNPRGPYREAFNKAMDSRPGAGPDPSDPPGREVRQRG